MSFKFRLRQEVCVTWGEPGIVYSRTEHVAIEPSYRVVFPGHEFRELAESKLLAAEPFQERGREK